MTMKPNSRDADTPEQQLSQHGGVGQTGLAVPGRLD
jgi:hypothetical protein